MFLFLREGFDRFLRNPLGETVAAALFLLASATGILLGGAALLYLSHLAPKKLDNPMMAQMQLLQQLQGVHRTTAAFWIGLIIWAIILLPSFQSPLFGIPMGWILLQPFWCALLLTHRYDLPCFIALKSVYHLTLQSPAIAFRLYTFGLLAFAGLFLFGIGIFITLPIALFATLRQLDDAHRELTSAIQHAY
jgi:hypothetical protein